MVCQCSRGSYNYIVGVYQVNETVIRNHYKAIHNKLSSSYYAGTSGLTKEQFDQVHGDNWAAMDAELIAGGYLNPPLPGFDERLDALESKISALEAKS